MRVVVCIRQGRNGEINPFDACAYEEALKIPGAEITLLSMGVPSCESFLLSLTRLGAARAVLLTDRAFAGADTLATAYTLSLAVKKIAPELVLCGRQTLEGDTGQTAPMLAQMLGYRLITNAMHLDIGTEEAVCDTRAQGRQTAGFPLLITVERINNLRLPSLRSRFGTVEVWSADTLGADRSLCGLSGSPTRVLETHENEAGKRKCRFIAPEQLTWAIEQGLKKREAVSAPPSDSPAALQRVWIVGEAPRAFAETISRDITVIPLESAESIAEKIQAGQPQAVLWGSDSVSKRVAAQTAAILRLGLCADCTSLETDGKTLFMIRPALSGSVIAKIKSLTVPAMATVRTVQNDQKDIIVCIGYGAKDSIGRLEAFAESIGAQTAATRKAVDHGLMPYDRQVGLTGKTVAPPVYIAVGVSGAVHHIVGMKQSGTVIAVNPDRNAPIFEYADYGILSETFLG